MNAEAVEVECPVCDHKVAGNAIRCPKCGADFSMSGVDELEKVAKEINDPDTMTVPSAPEPEDVPPPSAPTPLVKAPQGGTPGTATKAEAKDQKEGLLGRLFKKKGEK